MTPTAQVSTVMTSKKYIGEINKELDSILTNVPEQISVPDHQVQPVGMVYTSPPIDPSVLNLVKMGFFKILGCGEVFEPKLKGWEQDLRGDQFVNEAADAALQQAMEDMGINQGMVEKYGPYFSLSVAIGFSAFSKILSHEEVRTINSEFKAEEKDGEAGF